MKNIRSLTWYDVGKWLVAALLLCGAAAARGQEPIEVTGGDVKPVKIVKYIKTTVDGLLITKLPATLKVPGSGLEYKWTLPATVKSNVDRNTVEIVEAPNGEMTASVTWKVVDFDAKKIVDHASTLTVMIGEVVQPKPPDDTKPPPTTDPAPIPDAGLRVLIVCETTAGPPALNLIISGEKVRSYMKDKGAPGGFLALDKDLTYKDLVTAGQPKWVVDAYNRPRASIPWIVVSNGKAGYEGPLPLTNAPLDALNLIKKYGD